MSKKIINTESKKNWKRSKQKIKKKKSSSKKRMAIYITQDTGNVKRDFFCRCYGCSISHGTCSYENVRVNVVKETIS
jgi:hypothetical protein